MDINYLKENGIDVDKSLEILGDIETFNEILNDFYSELEDKLINLENYKKETDMENYSILVHALKGECKYLGINDLANICYEHQIKSEEANVDYINDKFDELIASANKVKEIVKKYLESI